jgi:DNA-binding response OmpR family regulator
VASKILIVEDEEAIRQLLSEIFSILEDCSILYSRDGEEALRTARVNSPDIVLLDVQIPKLNGYEVCRSIKSDGALAGTKILMLSGMAQYSDRQQALDAGADAFITKPFDTTAFINKVEGLLKK